VISSVHDGYGAGLSSNTSVFPGQQRKENSSDSLSINPELLHKYSRLAFIIVILFHHPVCQKK
jgi:hypothetical protein